MNAMVPSYQPLIGTLVNSITYVCGSREPNTKALHMLGNLSATEFPSVISFNFKVRKKDRRRKMGSSLYSCVGR